MAGAQVIATPNQIIADCTAALAREAERATLIQDDVEMAPAEKTLILKQSQTGRGNAAHSAQNR